MKKLSAIFLLAIYIATVAFTGVAFAENCSGWKYYDSNLEECVTCPNSGFTITTTGLAEGTTFLFSMSPKGSFAVDWGDGTIQNIDRDNTTAEEYSHPYTTGGSKTIKFCGKATEYNMAAGDNVRTGDKQEHLPQAAQNNVENCVPVQHITTKHLARVLIVHLGMTTMQYQEKHQ